MEEESSDDAVEKEEMEEEEESEVVDDREELSLSNVRDIYDPSVREECFMDDFNAEEPNTTVTLTMEENGVEFEIPYNEDWGNDAYSVSPYEFEGTRLIFGQLECMGIEGPPDWYRPYYIELKPYMSIEEVEFMVRENPEMLSFAMEPELVTYGDLDGIKYAYDALCAGGAIEVVGEDNNYYISGICIAPGPRFDLLEDVAESIKIF